MDIKHIIEMVTKEVLNRLESAGEIKDSKKVLIAGNKSKEYEKLYELLSINYSNILFLDQIGQGVDLAQIDYIIVPKLENNALAKLALGVADDEVTLAISETLLRGKQITLLEEGIAYRKFKGLANASYYDMFKSYEEKLKEYGMTIIKQEDLHLQKSKTDETLKIGKTVINKKIIVESDVKKVYEAGHDTIQINDKSIISPLASDYIKINDINITKKG
ncbi:hypothetical protein PV797_16420 [Clostridiaceae bacterium M8S5]|nr:hypothetical protein PV797_16420 [Clostridiaceae bacterium M8S5]